MSDDSTTISPETIAEVARIAREWPDGIHTCAELQRLEPGRRPCTCGRCPETAKRDRLNEQRIDLARTIADQAQAIADGTVTGPQYGAVRRLLANAETLMAWTADDRSG